MHLKNIAAIAATMVLSLTLLSSCSSGGGDTNTNLAPTPEGVLLLGADDDPAVSAIIQKSSVPVDPSQIKTGGLLSTRLDAVINPAATVAEVNTALESVGAKIDGMTANNPILVLSIAEVVDRAAAQAIADTLQANDAFFFVTVTFEAKPAAQNIAAAAQGLSSQRILAQMVASPPSDWYQAARFPALSRADVVANAVNQPVTIIIPSTYAAGILTDTSNIPNFSFLDGIFADGTLVNDYGNAETDPVLGSYGYSIASLIGIDDSTSLTSAYPETNNNLLRIDAAPLGGLSYTGIITVIESSVKDSITFETVNNKLILLTDYVYNDDDFSDRDRVWRAIDALNWRKINGGFLHVSAVGELGSNPGPAAQAKYSSPFAVSEAYPDLSLLIAEIPDFDPNSPAALEFVELRFALDNRPSIGNLILVGSSRIDGFTRSDFSIPGADVRMIGENVEASCYTVSENCVDNQWLMSDTGVAAAQIAALAAWMLNMDSTLNEAGVMTVINYAYQNGQLVGIVDTYAALLSLDTSITEAPIRKSILDVIDTLGTGVRDGIFDEGDIGYWFNTILPTFPDGLPFDLNGDGHIGGSDTAWFDLDINALPVYTTVMQTIGAEEVSFNEEAVTDFDVLCYYAYSDLYTGDEAQRDDLLQEICNQPLFLIIEVDGPEELEANEFETIEIKLLDNSGSENLAGLFIKIINVTGGSVSTQNGVTDSEGVFTTMVNLNEANEGEEGGLEFIIEVSTTENGDSITSIEHSIDLVALSPDGVYYISQTHLVGATFLNADPVLLFGSSVFGGNGNSTVTVTDGDPTTDNFVRSRLSYGVFNKVNNAIVFGEGLQIQSVADVLLRGVGSINANYSRVGFEVIGTAMPYSLIFSNNTDVGNMTWEMKLTDQSGNFIVNCPLQGSCGNTTNFSGELSGLLNAGIYIFELDVGLTGQGSARATAILKIGEVDIFVQ